MIDGYRDIIKNNLCTATIASVPLGYCPTALLPQRPIDCTLMMPSVRLCTAASAFRRLQAASLSP